MLTPDKFEHCVTSIPFVGHLLTSDGLKPDSAKLFAILDMPEPTDVATVRCFIGAVNYLAKYLLRWSPVAKTLTSLTHNDHAGPGDLPIRKP